MKSPFLYIAAALLAAPFTMADELSDLKAASDAVYASLLDPAFVPYKRPNERITEWIALGDSYTAGTGANGKGELFGGGADRGRRAYPMQMSENHNDWGFINGDSHLPRFSFHAYTGDTTKELKEEQLKQGIFKDEIETARGQMFGKPQIATLTIGGNDALLGKILNACIYQYWTAKDCDETLAELDNLITSNKLKYEVTLAIENVVASGRLAGGANPAESFQVYIPEYVTFFADEMTEECNDYTWGTLWVKPKLTVRLRERLNEFTRRVNTIVKETAQELEAMGVIYVEGLNDAYNGHRYCENGADEKMTGGDVWFWTKFSKQDSDSESEAQDINHGQEILNFVWPGENKVVPQSTDGQSPPWEWPGAEKYPDADSLLRAMRDTPDLPEAQGWTPFDLLRSFHPKGTAYGEHATQIFAAIVANRDDVDTTSDPEPTDAPEPPAEDKNECHGVGGDYWVMSRDTAVENAEAFCGQGDKVVKYNEGSVNELELSVYKDGDDSKGPQDDPNCLGRLQNAVIDGCDGNNPEHNPHNYKFGSKFTSADGWVYEMKPLSQQVNEVSCDVSYKFFFDFFEIRGKNLPDAKLGANGEGLKRELEGCGLLTKWNFERTPNDVKFQWYAKGQLPIGTKACTGRALVSAGGADQGNCHGAGRKRSTRMERRRAAMGLATPTLKKRDSIDDWPGYGEDEAHVFGNEAVVKRDSIDEWPGYGEEAAHVFKDEQ